MTAYSTYGIKAFKQELSYRTEVWLSILGNFIMIFIQVSIWKAIMGESNVAGISLEQMITYTIINTIILSLLLTNVFRTVDQDLKSGKISIYLIKPTRYSLLLIAENLGRVMYRFTFTSIPTMIICIFLFNVSYPSSAKHGIYFILSICICMTLSFLLGYLIALISFWFLTTFALEWSLSALMTVFSGSFFPIWFFPDFWAKIAQMLPFQFLGFIPASIYLGEIQESDLFITTIVGLAWCLGLTCLVMSLWKWAMRSLIIQGG